MAGRADREASPHQVPPTSPQPPAGVDPRVARWRADTPGCAHRIHLNNAGAALPPSPVVAAVRDHLEREAEIGGYEAAEAAVEPLHAAYESLGAMIGAPAGNIAVVEKATVAVAQARSSVD